MTTTSTPDPKARPETDGTGSTTGSGARALRMPVMGWIRDIATSENWRTTTIVRRHRDSASTPGLI